MLRSDSGVAQARLQIECTAYTVTSASAAAACACRAISVSSGWRVGSSQHGDALIAAHRGAIWCLRSPDRRVPALSAGCASHAAVGAVAAAAHSCAGRCVSRTGLGALLHLTSTPTPKAPAMFRSRVSLSLLLHPYEPQAAHVATASTHSRVRHQAMCRGQMHATARPRCI